MKAGTLANSGVNSSLGSGNTIAFDGGTLSYTGGGASTDRALSISGNGTIRNDGTGALSFGGATTFLAGGAADTLTLGGGFANTLSGAISGAGSLTMNGSGSWLVSGDNTFTGTTTVQSGTLTAGSATAFGTSNPFVINGGILNLGGFNVAASSLAGSGGTIDLGAGTLTVESASGSTSYAGAIAGSGGLTKLGASTQTLTGQSTYTGATTVGAGTLALDFSGVGGPASNIISGGSTLNLGGGTLSITGANGEANSQSFNGLNVTGGSNTLRATSGTTAGSSLTVNLGAVAHSGGIINFVTPTSGFITTTNADGTLGGWATVTNGSTTNYAQVSGGNIIAITNYTNQDNASLWLDNQFISDEGGTANTPFSNTVSGSKQLGGLKYTAAANSTVNVNAGQTLGVDGTIIVNSSVGGTSQTIQGGSVTGMVGGGTLGVLQNSTGTFTIASDIVDNGGATAFVVGGTGGTTGTGVVALTGDNSYTGATTVSGATLAFDSVANGGSASAIGASSNASSNLVLENGTLRYTGATGSTDRGFTLVNGGTKRDFDVSNAATNVTFSGVVTSPDDAGFTKTGAGTLTLGNANNSYIGVTTVAGGTLAVAALANGGSNSSIGASSSDSSNLVLQGGGELEYLGGTATTDRGFTLGSGGGQIDVAQGATTLTVGGTVTGPGALFKNGPGTLVLSGTNTFTGGGAVNAGILQAGSAQALGANGGWTVVSGATLDLNDFNTTLDVIAGAGTIDLGSATLTIDSASTLFPFSGSIIGSGGLTVTGGGTQVINGCGSSYTGITTLSGASLSTDCLRDSGQASGIGASSNVSGGLVFNNGRLTYTGVTTAINRGFNLNSSDGYINVSSAATTLGFGGQVTGNGRLRKEGGGTLVLSATNNFAGGTVHDGGTLRAGATNAFGTGYVQFNSAGAVLDLANFNTTIAYLQSNVAGWGTTQLGSATLTISSGSLNGLGAVYSGAISGTGGIVKNGGGYQQFLGCNNSYSGSTTINLGPLVVDCLVNGSQNSSIGSSSSAASNLVLNGGMLRYIGAGGSTDRQFTLGAAGGSLDASGTGVIDFASTAAITLAGTGNRTLTLGGSNTGNNSLSALIANPATGTTALTKQDAGTWILRNANSTYTGRTTINGGVLGVDKLADGGAASSIGMSALDAANLVIGNGSTLRYTGAGDSTNRLFTLSTGVSFIEASGTGAIVFSNTGSALYSGAGARTLALGGTNTGLNTMGGTIIDQNATTGKTTLAKNDPGTWVLTGNNSYSGNTVINDGDLRIGDGNTTGNAGTGNVIVVNPTSTLSFNRSDAFNFAGTLSGLGNIAQIGPGTTVLTAANNTIGGVTSVDAGTLQIAGGSQLSTGSAEINAGTLQVQAGGSLTTPAIAMNAGSTLTVNGTVQAAGATTTTITGDAGNSTINVNAGGTLLANGDLGAGTDTVNVTGTLSTGTGVLNLGGGDDTLTLNEGATFGDASFNAGDGNDTLQVNHVSPWTLDAGDVTAFENLVKQNAGTLTLTGNQTFGTSVQVQGGALIVGDDATDSLTTAAVTMADGTTLQVNGTLQNGGGTAATLTGSAGANTVIVGSGATLVASGDLGDGNDSLNLSGTLNTGAGTLNLGAGDDTVTIGDGTVLAGGGINAGGQTATDLLVLDNALALSFDGSRTAGFEQLVKQNTGTATMTGSQSFGSVSLDSGALTVGTGGSLIAPAVMMADNTTLNVSGTLAGDAVGGAAAITGSAGVNTVTVASGATLTANGKLGGGNDVLDVAGTLDIVGGTFELGDGDDQFVVHDGTVVNGTIDGGAGLDSRVYNINTTANLGTLLNFEGVTKTGTGTLNINGPGATDLQDVQVLGGRLNIGAGASVVATADSPLNTVVGSGATLNVDGAFGCGAGNDTMTVSGAVSGSGTINLCGGNDTLTLNDGADLSGFSGVLDGAAGDGDRVVLNNAGTMSVPGNLSNFEFLQKDNTGEAVLTQSMAFTGGTEINGGTLTVNRDLRTPTVGMADNTTLNVSGTLAGNTGGAAAITGSAGVNTVRVAAGATLTASGDLGDGNDVFDIAGTLNTAGGTFSLGAGDDTFKVYDSTDTSLATVDGGLGNDTLDVNVGTGNTVPLGGLLGFESLGKSGAGTLEIHGASEFIDVNLNAGTLRVTNTGSIAAANTTILSGATLALVGNGSYSGTAGNDSFTVAGTVTSTGTGTLDLGAGDDTFTIQDGADLSGLGQPVNGGAGTDNFVADLAGTATLGGAVGFETLTKTNTGTLIVAGPATSAFTTVNVAGGTLNVGVNGSLDGVVTGTVANGATLDIDGRYTGSAGNDTLTVAGVVSGAGGIALGGGDDILTLNDGADFGGFTGTLDGGMHGSGDRVVLNNSGAMNFAVDNIVNFEFLQKDNTGEAILAGTAEYSGGTQLNGGTLTVNGNLRTPTIGMADNTTLNVSGTLAGNTGGAAAITGSAGVNTVRVAANATLTATGDLGDGNDVFDVAGTLNTAGGTFSLGAGDDTFNVYDSTDTSLATVDGGLGNDTLDVNVGAGNTVPLGALLGFESLGKSGAGTLEIHGASDFIDVNLNAGTLRVTDTGSIAAVNTTILSGATLALVGNGSYSGTAGNDSFTVAGTVTSTGTGTLDLGAGDDTFTIQDGADLSGLGQPVNGGAGTDNFVADLAGTATLGGAVGFETLTKTNTGTLIVAGPAMSSFSTIDVQGGTLDIGVNGGVTGVQNATVASGATLNIDGAFGFTAGVDHFTVAGTVTGTSMFDMLEGDDVLDVIGTLDIGGGVLALGDGDDQFVVHDGTVVNGTIDGGAGLDSRVYNINTTATLGTLLNFEGVTKTGAGTLNINGPGATDLQEVQVLGGTLNIAAGASVVATAGSTLNTVVGAGATLNVDGAFGCGAGDDTITVSGTVSGSGRVDLCAGDDVLVLNDGAVLATVIDGNDPTASDTVVLNNADAMTYDASNTVNFEHLRKENVGEATMIGAATFSDDTTLVGGTLTVAGNLTTPIVTMADGTTLNVGGALQGTAGAATVTGSAGANTITIAGKASMIGDLGGGNDVLDVAGTLDTAGVAFALGDGDDTLIVHDGTNILGAIAGGAGTDTFNADIATTADLGAVQGFETLRKTGAGALNVNGPASSDFVAVSVDAGTLHVGTAGSIAAQATTVASGASLLIDGAYTGTAGNDTFTSMGTVRGALAFGESNDTARFVGGDPSGVTSLDGGAGSGDVLGFSDLALTGMPALSGWERVELLDGSALTLGGPLELSGGTLAIDGTSRLTANAGAAIRGSVENAGLLDVGMNRLAIGGAYTSNGGALRVAVSATNAGGLSIDGDVAGDTQVLFVGDGSDLSAAGSTPILVIASPNDNAGTAGSFVPADTANGKVRVGGSVSPWTFGQQADRNWYLSPETTQLLPEISGYGALSGLGTVLSQQSGDLVQQRLAGMRGTVRPQCGEGGRAASGQSAGDGLIEDCHGAWIATSANELKLGANPGFAVSGDDVGLYAGIDGDLERENRTLRAGGYIGLAHGVYWTSGASSTALAGTGPARIELDTPVVGMYASNQWDSGGFVDLVLSGHRPRADIRTVDGFAQRIVGNYLTLSARAGRDYRLDGGWMLAPELELTASHIHWQDTVDAAERQLRIDDDVVGTARAALRIEKTFVAAGGAQVRPWARLAVQNVVGEKESGLHVSQPGSSAAAQVFPSHDLGTSASLDVGVEASLNRNVSLFGVLSAGRELDGSDYEQRSANVGVSLRW